MGKTFAFTAFACAVVVMAAMPAARLLAQAPAPAPTAPTAANPWTNLAPFPNPSEEVLGASAGGKFYVFAGASVMPDSEDTTIHPARRHMVVGTVEEYDPAANTWRARASLPTPRNHHVVAAAGGRIWVIGGRIGAAFITSGSNTDIVEGYDPATNTWTPP